MENLWTLETEILSYKFNFFFSFQQTFLGWILDTIYSAIGDADVWTAVTDVKVGPFERNRIVGSGRNGQTGGFIVNRKAKLSDFFLVPRDSCRQEMKWINFPGGIVNFCGFSPVTDREYPFLSVSK